MGRIFKMKNICLIILIIALISSCNPNEGIIGSEDIPLPPDHGWAEVAFIVPGYKLIPDKNIHRISLGFAYTVDSLYRSEFFKKVNVSDHQEVYRTILPEGEYYYEAVITCSCDGDTCLNGGFPGGKFGMKHDFLNFVVINELTSIIKTNFE